MKTADNITLEYLSAVRAGIAGFRNNLQEVKERLTGIQAKIGGLERGAGDTYSENAGQYVRYDCLPARIEKIE